MQGVNAQTLNGRLTVIDAGDLSGEDRELYASDERKEDEERADDAWRSRDYCRGAVTATAEHRLQPLLHALACPWREAEGSCVETQERRRHVALDVKWTWKRVHAVMPRLCHAVWRHTA